MHAMTRTDTELKPDAAGENSASPSKESLDVSMLHWRVKPRNKTLCKKVWQGENRFYLYGAKKNIRIRFPYSGIV